MTTYIEKVEGAKMRMFKWKESLFNDTVSKYGLFVCITDNEIITKKFPESGGDGEAEETAERKNITRVRAFDVTILLDRDNFEPFFQSALSSTELFSEETTEFLAPHVSAWIRTSFQFTAESLIGPGRARIVIVVDVNMQRILDYTDNDAPENCLDGKRDEESTNQNHYGGETEQVETEQGETEQDESMLRSYLDGFLGDDDDDDAMDLEAESEEDKDNIEDVVQVEEGNLEIMNISRKLMPWLIDTPEALAVAKPRLSIHFREFKKVNPLIKVRKFDGHQEFICSTCGDWILTGMVVAELPCLHIFHKACIFRRVNNVDSCPLCGLTSATLI